jgi:hypothetical protein
LSLVLITATSPVQASFLGGLVGTIMMSMGTGCRDALLHLQRLAVYTRDALDGLEKLA